MTYVPYTDSAVHNLSDKLHVIHNYLITCGINGINDYTTAISVKHLKNNPSFLEDINQLTQSIKQLFSTYEVNFNTAKCKTNGGLIHSHEFAIDVLKSMLLCCYITFRSFHKQDGNYLVLVDQSITNDSNNLRLTFKCHREVAYDTAVLNCEKYVHVIEQHRKNNTIVTENINKNNPWYAKAKRPNGEFILNKKDHDIIGINVTNNSSNPISFNFCIGGSEICSDVVLNEPKNVLNVHQIPFIPEIKYQIVSICFNEGIKNIEELVTVTASYIQTQGLDIVNIPIINEIKFDKNVLGAVSGLCAVRFSKI